MADLTFVGVTPGNDSTLTVSSVNVAAPGGTASGHLDLMMVSAAVVTGGGAPTLSMGAGWEQVATFTYTNQGGLDGRQSVFRRTGSTVQTETVTASANSAWSWDRLVYSGQHPTIPITVTPVLGLNASATNQVIPSITTDNPRAQVIYQLGGLSAVTTWTPGSGVTERSDHNAACTGDILQATAGAVGTKTFVAAVANITLYAVVAVNSDFLRISAEPSNQNVNNGATATFSVTATGGTTAYTYQWQDNSSGSFANISGATSSSYAPTAAYSMQGRQYKCIVTDAISSTVTSATALLRVATNLTGTGPRSFPLFGGAPIGAGTVNVFIQNPTTGGGTTFIITPSGGIVFSGTNIFIRGKTFQPTGSIVFSGAAALIKSKIIAPSGGIVFSGTAPQIRGKFYSPTGGITFSGTASNLRGRVYTPTGGITLTGSAEQIHGNVIEVTGSITFGGTAPMTFGTAGGTSFVINPSGGITFSGSALMSRGVVYSPTGSLNLSGTNLLVHGKVYAPTGGVTFSGTNLIQHQKTYVPTGSITFSGSAPMTFTPAGGGGAAVSTRLPMTFAGTT